MKTLLAVIALSGSMCATATKAQVPNAGFENWTFYGWFYNPDSWTTNNNQIMSTFVSPDSDAYNGQLAMKLYNHSNIRPWAKTNFPVSSSVSSFSFYAKLNLITNDTVTAKLTGYNNGVVADSGYWTGTAGLPAYTLINVPVSQNSIYLDSVELQFTGGNQNNLVFEGTAFVVDDVQLSLSNSISGNSIAPALFDIRGPFNNQLIISTNIPATEVWIDITETSGKFVQQHWIPAKQWLNNNVYVIDVSLLSRGVYLLQLRSKYYWSIYKFLIQ